MVLLFTAAWRAFRQVRGRRGVIAILVGTALVALAAVVYSFTLLVAHPHPADLAPILRSLGVWALGAAGLGVVWGSGRVFGRQPTSSDGEGESE